ncbi:MAG: hypothetical protein KC503_37210 [Myxococcales bacterium]|nr:hypothetical protein [Myxococcales bacterium]
MDAGDASVDIEGVDGVSPPPPVTWPAQASSGYNVAAPTGDAHNIRLARDHDGAVWALWADNISGNYEVYVARVEQSGVVGVGGSLEPGGISRSPGESRPGGIAFDNNNQPVVVWMENATRGVWLKRYDAANDRWVEVGASVGGRHRVGQSVVARHHDHARRHDLRRVGGLQRRA